MDLTRTEALLGDLSALYKARVIIFGIGGVGGYVCEALARCGIGKITLVDGDRVSGSNINRQIVALHSTMGKFKAEVMADRISDINPRCDVKAEVKFLTEENIGEFSLESYDYIADCIDSVKSKLALIEYASVHKLKIISCMGSGNKLMPRFEVADISKTSVCPLARVIRTELRKRGIAHLKTVYSAEEPVKCGRTPSSVSFVPSVAGLTVASEIIKDLLKEENKDE